MTLRRPWCPQLHRLSGVVPSRLVHPSCGTCCGLLAEDLLSIPLIQRSTAKSAFPKGCKVQPITTAIINPTTSFPHASHIPLQSLPSDSRILTHPSRSLESASEKGSRRSSHSSARSVESDFSVWSDTGDLAEQSAGLEDPLQVHTRRSFDRQTLGRERRSKQRKHVHYSSDLNSECSGIDIEKIRIPTPPPRHISSIEKVLAAIMTPRNRPNAHMHGLVGKPLL